MTATTYEEQTAVVVSGTATIDAGETTTDAIVVDYKTDFSLFFPDGLTLPTPQSGSTIPVQLSFLGQAFDGGDFLPVFFRGGLASVNLISGQQDESVAQVLRALYAFKIALGVTQTAAIEIQFAAASPSSNVSASVPSSSANVAATQVASTAPEDNIIAKASAGNLYGITVNSTTAQFIQVHNTAALPSGGAVPFAGCAWAIAANGTLTVNFDPPLRCSVGITIVNSTTLQTWSDGADDCLFGIQIG